MLDDVDAWVGAAGDWPCRIVVGRFGERILEVRAASTGKPYIARIVGRDPTYSWKREFLKAKWTFPSRAANPAAVVILNLPVVNVGQLPAALEIRWGPATGGMSASAPGQRMCAFRAFFILDLAGFRQVEDRHIVSLIDEGLLIPGPPKRPPDMRARIDFDEEV